jgi:glutathione synthase/RimK-type ligase-like ATP-grasp enzyme
VSESKVTLNISSDIGEHDVMLGGRWIKKWKMAAEQNVTLRFGAWRETVKIIPDSRFDGIRISQTLARRMGLLQDTPIRIKYSSSTLALGPLIGVMITRDDPTRPDRPFRSITPFCSELVDACRKQGAYVYFFTPNDLKGQISHVQGWVYANGWRKVTLPAPDVVNNRLTTRKLEDKPSVQHFMREVKSRYNASVFNEKFLNKSEVFEALAKAPSLRHYLPESHLLSSFRTLKDMCTRHRVVFLKPIRGSLGKGIIRISRHGSSYICHFATVNGTVTKTYPSLLKMFSGLSGKIRSTRYQIQQGINIAQISGRPVDFRALVQKNGLGKWAITSVVARIASNHHFVSNLARGGTMSSVRDALIRSNLTAGKLEAPAGLRKAALEIAKGIDAHIPAHFGELGVDLAVDTGGKIWLLEVNSKPSKNMQQAQPNQKVRPSARQMVRYAQFISGF